MRQRIPHAVLAAMAAVLAASSAVAHAADFRNFQANPAHTGHVRGESFRPPLKRLWARDLGGSASYPIIAANRIFLTVDNHGYEDTTLIALDALTGRTLWSRRVQSGYPWSNATYAHGRLFNLSENGELTAYRPATGAELWSRRLSAVSKAPPTAADDSVYASTLSDAWFTVPEWESTPGVFALRQDNGRIRWGRPVLQGAASAPTLGERNLFVNYSCGQVYALDRRTGATAWHFDTNCAGPGGQTTTLYRGELWTREVYGRQDPIVFDAGTGKPLRHFPSSMEPAFAKGVGYFVRYPGIEARRAATGRRLWQFSGGGPFTTAALVVGPVVYAGAYSGRVHAVSARTGKSLWKDDTGATFAGNNTSSLGVPSNGLGAGRGLLVAPNAKGVVVYAARRGTMSCRRPDTSASLVCRSGDLPLFAGSARARLLRKGVVRATGSAAVGHGRIRVTLDPNGAPGAGRYTLRLHHDPSNTVRRFRVTIRY
jgi:outer membrane protein assembly factor BamB